MRLHPRPRLVDWSILVTVMATVVSGVMSLTAGRPGDWPIFVAHGVAGMVLVVLLGWKFRRVAGRVSDPDRWTPATAVSIATATLAVAALATGLYWVFGGNFQVLLWNALNIHILFGLLIVPFLLVHLRHRFRLPTTDDIEGRRTVVQYSLLLSGGVLAWRLQQALVAVLDTAGAARRFTGSKPQDGEASNDFPVTSWVADDPDPIDRSGWSLAVTGAVETPQSFEYQPLIDGTLDERQATLDCTSGWYATRDWRGIRIGRLLDAVGTQSDARWVSFRSVTGYRFSLPIEEAREALLATHDGAEPLTHGHGAPARLVAPGRRGFQWVKWVVAIEIRTTPDYGQWIAIFTSAFTADSG
ncbi:MAG: molybdopterin-dependent oxidoreductase [Halobacteriales archaeon]